MRLEQVLGTYLRMYACIYVCTYASTYDTRMHAFASVSVCLICSVAWLLTFDALRQEATIAVQPVQRVRHMNLLLTFSHLTCQSF